jgi:hypothetical protein
VDPHGGSPQASQSEPAEAALARALDRATAEGRWDVVPAIVAELQARRAAKVVAADLDADGKAACATLGLSPVPAEVATADRLPAKKVSS